MTRTEWEQVKEVELLRLALSQAEALCDTLDRAEFCEPIDFEGQYDATRAMKSIRKRLEFREAKLLRHVENSNGRLKSFAV